MVERHFHLSSWWFSRMNGIYHRPVIFPKMTHMRVGGISPKLSNSTIFVCGFFPDILGLSEWCLLLVLGLVVWISWDLWTSKTVGWLLIHDEKTPSLNIFGMVQLPTKYFNIQLLKGEGFKSATCWRKKSTQETDRKTHWDQPSTKKNLDFSLTKWRFPCS